MDKKFKESDDSLGLAFRSDLGFLKWLVDSCKSEKAIVACLADKVVLVDGISKCSDVDMGRYLETVDRFVVVLAKCPGLQEFVIEQIKGAELNRENAEKLKAQTELFG